MMHRCDVCNTSNYLDDVEFFDANGECVDFPSDAASTVCIDCLEAIVDYDFYSPPCFFWNTLTENQQNQLIPIIIEAGRKNKIPDLITDAGEDFGEETFDSWIYAVKKSFKENVL